MCAVPRRACFTNRSAVESGILLRNKLKEYQPHPLSEIFPLMPASDIKDLSEDIKQRGLQNPITLFEDKVLDGRHRQEACLVGGIKPRYVEYKGKDPLGFVIAANLKRRHLTPSQKAMVAAAIENIPHGGDRKSEKDQDANLHLDRSTVAESLDVSPRSVATASKILEESPKLAAQVRDGTITVHAAAEKLAEKSKEEKVVLDKTGLPIPRQCMELWNRTSEVQKFLTWISEMRSTLKHAQEQKDLLWGGLSYSGAIPELNKAYCSIECAKPYAVCPKCQGKLAKSCVCCNGRGLISQYKWDTSITREEKAMRAKVVEKLKEVK